jgi:hypothetical protein
MARPSRTAFRPEPESEASAYTSGSWFTKTVENDTGTAWTSFVMALQEILGTASGEGDGLSFLTRPPSVVQRSLTSF